MITHGIIQFVHRCMWMVELGTLRSSVDDFAELGMAELVARNHGGERVCFYRTCNERVGDCNEIVLFFSGMCGLV